METVPQYFTKFEGETRAFTSEMRAFAAAVIKRFDSVDARFDATDGQLDAIATTVLRHDEQFVDMNHKVDILTTSTKAQFNEVNDKFDALAKNTSMQFVDVNDKLDVITTVVKSHDEQLDAIATAVLRHENHSLRTIPVIDDHEERIGTLERSDSRLRLRSS